MHLKKLAEFNLLMEETSKLCENYI
jgi:hypothetical protein